MEEAKGPEEQIVDAPEQVIEAPEQIVDAPKPIMEAPKPIMAAPVAVVPQAVFFAPEPEPILQVQEVIQEIQEPVIEFKQPEVIEAVKFFARPIASIAFQAPVIEEIIEEEVVVEFVEEPVEKINLLGVGSTGDTISSTLNIGYYSMSNGQGVGKQVAPIEDAGHTAVKMTTLSHEAGTAQCHATCVRGV